MDDVEAETLHSWHEEELVRLGFDRHRRERLHEWLEAGTVELVTIRDYIEKHGWTVDEAFMAAFLRS
jgi:hypothetical protein